MGCAQPLRFLMTTAAMATTTTTATTTATATGFMQTPSLPFYINAALQTA